MYLCIQFCIVRPQPPFERSVISIAFQVHLRYFTPNKRQPLASCAYRLGKWKAAQKKPRAVLFELTTVSAKYRAFKASSRLRANLRANRIRLDEDLTAQQMQQRKGLSSDFLGLKIRGFKPFFRGTTLKYRDDHQKTVEKLSPCLGST